MLLMHGLISEDARLGDAHELLSGDRDRRATFFNTTLLRLPADVQKRHRAGVAASAR